MKFRPRYSLLTLLILTALVAGGVKIWYGPHHVVEHMGSNTEEEYTYTRDWRGNRTIHGIYVTRQNLYIRISYYRDGKLLPWIYKCYVDVNGHDPAILYDVMMGYMIRQADESEKRRTYPLKQTASPLTPEEWQTFRESIETEKRRVYPPGTKLFEYEGGQMHYMSV